MLKKLLIITFNILIINTLVVSQNLFFSDTISWSKIIMKNYYNEGKNIENILFAKNLFNKSDNLLPYYSHREKINNLIKFEKILLENVKFEQIHDSFLVKVRNLELIKNDFEIQSWTSVSRNNNFINVDILPIRKNKNTGKFERITYFECKIITNSVPKHTKAVRNYANSSKLSSGKWYKIKVAESKMYKLSYSDLISMGFSDADMNSIGVFGYGGMLQKEITGDYIDDLPELAVHKVDANNNSVFDSGDYFLFYADGPKNVYYNIDGIFSHTLHEYSNYSYYFVSNRGTWKQAANINSESTSNKSTTTYDEYNFLEKDSINLIQSGRTWYWKTFDMNTQQQFSINNNNISLADSITVKVNMAVRSSAASNFTVNFNGITSAPVNCEGFSDDYTYAKEKSFSKKFKTNSENFVTIINYNKTTSSSVAWLNYISFSYRKNLTLNSGAFSFRDIKSVGAGNITNFKISGANQNTVVWDISNRQNVTRILGNNNSGVYNFNANTTTLREFLAFDPSGTYSSPIFSSNDGDLGFIQNQNLHSSSQKDLIIVTHPNFNSQALSFKTLHEQHDNMSVIVVTPQEIYNEFSSGTPDISAIRNFVKMFYDRANSTKELPKNLMLLGDGSYDNKSTDPNVTNFILTYQAKESLNSLNSYVSDDFYVYMDEGEGNMSLYNDDIDLGVGRIPVKTGEEADNYVNKLRNYYSKESNGSYKNKFLMIADDADKPGEISFANCLIDVSAKLRILHPLYNVEHIFLDAYKQETTIHGQRYPDANQAFFDAINNGVFVVSWLGHGSAKGWAGEGILSINIVKSWTNKNKYPIFVTATCNSSPFDNHTFVSVGEEILLHPNGGGIALFTTTREVIGSSGESFTRSFFEEMLVQNTEGNYWSIGEVVMRSKTFGKNNSDRHNFMVLGDPAIVPVFPKYDVVTTKINDIDVAIFQDTIKAGAKIKISGTVNRENGSLANNFNGNVNITIYDKFQKYTTRGNDSNGATQFYAQQNILFKGNAKVINGIFSFSFIVPVDIAYFFDFGKISYYAYQDNIIDANGYKNDVIIGGSADMINPDIIGPEIELYLNSEDFIDGGITNEKPILLVNLSDESGINTVGNGIGHDITLKIDENTAKITNLNQFYESKPDDFTTGNIKYQMSELSLGQHSLKLKAWDVFNNSSEKQLDFIVTNSSELTLDHIFNYPNPFSTYTEFYINHNQPFVELSVQIRIFTISGKHVKSLNTTVVCDGFQIPPIPWDGLDEYGDKIAKGVYIYKVTVKDNKKNKVEKIEKLMILR